LTTWKHTCQQHFVSEHYNKKKVYKYYKIKYGEMKMTKENGHDGGLV